MVEFYEGSLNANIYNDIILENLENLINNLPLSVCKRIFLNKLQYMVLFFGQRVVQI